MQQNQIGQKIAELRAQHGLTQEEIAAKCNINVRTIQRIEKGEVKPRSYTLKILSTALGYDLLNTETNLSFNNSAWVVSFYASSLIAVFMPWAIFVSIAFVAFMWMKLKNESELIYEHGKNVINSQIVLIILSLLLLSFLFFMMNKSMYMGGTYDKTLINNMLEYTSYYMKAYYSFIALVVIYSIVNILLFLLNRKPFRLAPNIVK
ncbi:MAG: helix-turn-helix transcriptional regulator [Ignavibacteriales bacterium]|nr:helix-turn-helix transcriptional regulator [Ignavibacteriales bacterium]